MDTLAGLEPFIHEPLNHNEPSIRLLGILKEESPDGLLQCNILHTTIEDTYTCLSYMWEHRKWDEQKGPKPSYQILINGKLLRIGENLFEFLNTARKKEYYSRQFWIDAICIDQSNIPEKTIQVQRMGQIYSYASEVICWLNVDPSEVREMEPAIRMFREQEEVNVGIVWKYWGRISRALVQDPYWSRAWIIQEIMLGKRVTLLIQTEELLLSKLLVGLQCQSSRQDFDNSYFVQFGTRDGRGIATASGKESLVQLLAQFAGRQATIPRDRVFSLLSLCGDGRDIKVDYAISEIDLMFQVLSHCNSSLCLCSAAIVAQSLGLANTASSEEVRDPYPYLEIDIPAKRHGNEPQHMLVSDNMFFRQAFFARHGKNGIEYEYSRTCPRFKFDKSLLWKEPQHPEHGEKIYEERVSEETQLCTYGKGFEVTKKNGEDHMYTLRIAFSMLAKSSAPAEDPVSGRNQDYLCARATQNGDVSALAGGNPRIAYTDANI